MNVKEKLEDIPFGAEGHWRIYVDGKLLTLFDNRKYILEKYGERKVLDTEEPEPFLVVMIVGE